MKYIVLAILFLTNAGTYLWVNPAFKEKYDYECRAWYFGTEGLFISLFLFLISYSLKWWYQRLIIRMVAGFELTRGILYVLNYTLIWTEEARYRMFILAVVSLIFIIIFVRNCFKLGFDKVQ